jgi:hypothetical protein
MPYVVPKEYVYMLFRHHVGQVQCEGFSSARGLGTTEGM